MRWHKYHAKKTTIDGITFDSRKEANRYAELKLLERAGEIKNLRLQVPFTLQESFTLHGKKYRPITYIADFVYEQDGRTIVEDTKGMRTQVYKLKKKLFLARYGKQVEFRES